MTAIEPLMEGLIDYAGLFPPAKLPMAQAVENFATYRRSQYATILNRFICPAQRLAEFAECAEAHLADASGAVWPIAALCRGGDTVDAFLANLDGDFAAMDALAERFGGCVRIDVLEVRLPEMIIDEGDLSAVRDLAARVAERVDASAPHALTPYYEIGFVGHWREHVPQILAGLVAHNKKRDGADARCRDAAVKVRTGGLEAHMFPSVDQLTVFISECIRQDIAFKATAGLHHPVRHFADAVGAKMHGFLNLFGGAVLARALVLDDSTIACIIEDETPEHFVVDGDWFRWQNFSANVRQIKEARKAFCHSFGSCSFDEPIDDLRELGLL